MGLVKLTEEITKEWEDLNGIYPCATATLYVYCDKCGSFGIASRIGHRRAVLIIVACILMAAGMFASFQLRGGIFWFCSCLALCLLAFRYLWGSPSYVCRRCGSEPTTRYNTLGYPSDIGILDVPGQLTQKRYLDYFPDHYDLDHALTSPGMQRTDGGNAFSLVLGDLEGLKTFLLYILCIPLVMIFTVSYPVFLILYVLYTEVISKLWIATSSGKDARLEK
jgi:hypothetical protein